MPRITYMTKTARSMRTARLLTVLRKVRASPWRLPRTYEGRIWAAAVSMKFVAVPRGILGLRLKKIVTLLNWLMWLGVGGPGVSSQVANALGGRVRWPSSLLM